jgi:hypothetical protein
MPLWNSHKTMLFSVSLYRIASQSPLGFTLNTMPEHLSESPDTVLNIMLIVPFVKLSTPLTRATG